MKLCIYKQDLYGITKQMDMLIFHKITKNQIDDSISKLSKFFTTSDNAVNITNIAVLEEVKTTIENLRVKFKDNQTALDILNEYQNTQSHN